ncbi:F-box only protein 4 [Holothuria leucospilota]|uniref:F-box only protein 4 n=1 Tax=Holothuria leucospilota TaxID=206669 RepID=A0A9Q1C8C0_HOLLE|nr:F-box only protein 4 [Holothuria leucospilota]
MFGDEKTISEVNALIQKQRHVSNLQEVGYGIFDWSLFKTPSMQQHIDERELSPDSVDEDVESVVDTSDISPLACMPVPVLMKVIALLDAKDVCSLGQTSLLFHSLCGDHLLWKQLLNNDKMKWNEVGHASNPSTYMDLHADMSFKDIYLRCSPDMKKKEKFHLMKIPRLIKSYLPLKAPHVVMFGPGLDSDTSRIVRKIINSEDNDIFKNRGPFPAMFPGSVGTGFTISMNDEGSLHQMRLITMYSGTKKSREISPLERRSERSRLLRKVETESYEMKYEPTDSIKQLCHSVSAFICVVESSQEVETVSGCMEELHTLMDLRWTPHTSPLLILSCTPDHDTPRLPCMTIAEQLQLHKLVRPWKVMNGVVSDLHGISVAIRWLIETALGTV